MGEMRNPSIKTVRIVDVIGTELSLNVLGAVGRARSCEPDSSRTMPSFINHVVFDTI